MRRTRGFTLLEVLVVVGTISVLVALLMPALHKTRQSAMRLACASNMRQLGVAVQAYAAENRGVLPFAAMKVSPPSGGTHAGMWCLSWDDLISDHLGGNLSTAEKEAAFNYKGLEVLKCPSDPYDPVYGTAGVHRRSYALVRAASAVNPNDGRPFGGVAYQWTVPSLAAYQPSGKFQLKISQIRNASSTFLAVENPNPWNAQGYDYESFIDTPAQVSPYVMWLGDVLTGDRARRTFHGDRWNFLYVDGHVESLQLEDTVRNGDFGIAHGAWTRHAWD